MSKLLIALIAGTLVLTAYAQSPPLVRKPAGPLTPLPKPNPDPASYAPFIGSGTPTKGQGENESAPGTGVEAFLRAKKELHPYVKRFGWQSAVQNVSAPCDRLGMHSPLIASTPPGGLPTIDSTHFCRDYAGNDAHVWRLAWSRAQYGSGGERIFRIEDNRLVLMVEFAPDNVVIVDNTGISQPAKK